MPGPTQAITDRYPGLNHLMMEFNQMKAFLREPLVVTDGDRVRLRDHTGRWIIDAISGVAAVQLGHKNRPIIDAMKAQLERVALTLPLHAVNEPELELAELLVAITPPEFTTIKFTSGGSEANEAAFKLVRQYHHQTGNPGKYKIISRYGSYHGATMGALAASGGAARKRKFEPFPTGFVHIHPPDCYHCPFKLRYPACGVVCAEILEQVILGEAPETVAAFIAEPVILSADAYVVPPPEYFQIIRRICDRYQVVLIYDEIITGFGRLGELFGADVYGVYPDILTVGKGLSGGYAPLAAVIMRDAFAKAFWGEPAEGVHFNAGHTYAGNPVACAAGLAAVRQIVAGEVLANVRRQSERLRARLCDMAARYAVIGRVDGHGLLQGVEFVTDRATHAGFPVSQSFCRAVGREALKRGLIARTGDHVYVLTPPLVATDADIDAMADILDASIAETLETFPS
ncbi:MAG: aspartate aminotransferase family protein [Actinobacteria bacterium]|nr:aspartate aminotransferase family protein [Actinomycetota bacterium]